MLLQRLRSAEPTVEAAIVYNLVELAIIAPENAFGDIIKAFSFINRSANPDDPRFSNNTVSRSFPVGLKLNMTDVLRPLLRKRDLLRNSGRDPSFGVSTFSSYSVCSLTKVLQFRMLRFLINT